MKETEELRQMLRFGAEWMEVVLLRSKFGANEESVPSWNMSPSGSLSEEVFAEVGTVSPQEAWPERGPSRP